MSRGLSPKLPLTKDPNDGYALNKDYIEMIKQNLKMLLLTAPGERIMEPLFGVGLRNFLFLEDTEDTYEEIKRAVYEQVRMYMPFVEVVSTSIIPAGAYTKSSGHGIDVYLKFKIVPLDIFDELQVSASN